MRPTRYKREFAVAQTVADMKRKFVYPDEDTQPRNPVVGGAGGAPTVVVAASDATDLSKQKADFICTGVNDWRVVQAAENMLFQNPSPFGNYNGGTLILTEGLFNFGTRGVDIRANTVVRGLGKGGRGSTVVDRGTLVYIEPATDLEYAFSFFGSSGSELAHMKLLSGVTRGMGIAASGAGAAVYCRDMHIHGFNRGVSAGHEPTIIERVGFDFCNVGVWLDGAEAQMVFDCKFTDAGGNSTVAIEGNCGRGSIVARNLVEGGTFDLGIDLDTPEHTQVLHNSVHVSDLPVAVRITDGAYCDVDGNQIGDEAIMGIDLVDCHDVTVRGNQVRSTAGSPSDAIRLAGDRNFVYGNAVDAASGFDIGINVASGNDNAVYANYLGDASAYGTADFVDNGTGTMTAPGANGQFSF